VQTGHTGAGTSNPSVYSPHLPKGVRLQGNNYAVGEVLGQGGFGITYKGGDLSLRRYVAIKEFFPQGCARQGSTVAPGGTLSAADYAGVKAKFIEEARTLARFSDPGIVRVFGVFEENNTAYMVMEFLEGQTLSARMSEKGTLDEAEVVGIAEKVGNALSVVHQAGLIHRDIKPDNICLTKEGRVVLIDFGTARSFATGKTVKHTTLLTPGYAPLEQYGNEARFGAYTDIYALAATLYHALTGQVPPQATDRAAGVELKAPHLLNPRVSAGVSQALVWALQVKAPDRPQNIKAFLAAFTPAVTNAPTPGGTELVVPSPPQVTNSGWGTPSPSAPPPHLATPNSTYATIQLVAENQILTNAAPQEVLGAVHRGFQAFGIANPTVDAASYRVLGSTGVDVRTWSQNVVGQVTQDARGTMITISSTASVGLTDYGRGREETRHLIAAVQTALQGLPASTPAYTPSPYAQPNYSPPIPPPQGGYYPPAQPMVNMQGGSVLTMGILGLFCCPILSLVAWITGNSALQAYGDRDPGDRGSVVAGRILGIIGTVLWGLYLTAVFISELGA
jgi:serine/threonine protein kinase